MNMENNLYYTPTIEEFHIGFEIECYVNGEWISINYMKNYTSGALRPSTLDIQNLILNNCIRVKYLDQSDIESLGWINTENLEFTKDTWILRKFEDGIIIHNDYSNGKYKFPWLYEDSTDKIFEGTIKNRSELIKLMQQLNIK